MKSVKGAAMARSAGTYLWSWTRRGLRHRPPKLRRAAPYPWPMFRNRRRGVNPDHMNISTARLDAAAGSGADRIIAGDDDPVDHPHGGGGVGPRGRYPVRGKPTKKPDQQIHGQIHCDLVTRARRRADHGALDLKGPFVDGYLLRRRSSRIQAAPKSSRFGVAGRPYCPNSSGSRSGSIMVTSMSRYPLPKI